MPDLPTLPLECLLVIADHTPKDQDLNSLAQTNRRNHAILNHYLYRRTVRSGDPKMTICKLIKTAILGAVRHWIKARGDVNTLVDGDSLLMHLIAARHFTRRYFGRLRNEACWKLLPKGRMEKFRMEVEKLKAQETIRMKTYYAIANLFVDRGADIHEPTPAGQPLLHVAALAGDKELVRLLVARGADVRSVTKRGSTALHAAALGANAIPILKFLLDHGADDMQIDVQTVDGITPLHGAIYANCKENAAFLLRNGAGAAYKACESKWELIYTDADDADFDFVPYEDMQEILLEHGIDPAAMGVCGRSRWACVTTGDTVAAIGCLVRIGVDVNIKGPSAEMLFRTAGMWGLEDSLVQWFLAFIPD